eukprot:761061-Hanusia_phi.AAC.5
MSAGLCAINKQGLAENMAHGGKVGKLKALYENLESNTSKPTKTERNSSRSNSLDNSSKEKIKTILANSITELHTIVQSSSHHQASALPSEERADQGGCNHAALPKDLSLAGTLEVHRDLEQNVSCVARRQRVLEVDCGCADNDGSASSSAVELSVDRSRIEN